MKRFAIALTVFASLAVFGAAAANAGGVHATVGHNSYATGYGGHGGVYAAPRHGYGVVRHGYAAPAYGYGVVRHGYAAPVYGGHGYAAPAYGGHGYVAPAYGGHNYYRSYGHGGGLRISTPSFGLQIGH